MGRDGVREWNILDHTKVKRKEGGKSWRKGPGGLAWRVETEDEDGGKRRRIRMEERRGWREAGRSSGLLADVFCDSDDEHCFFVPWVNYGAQIRRLMSLEARGKISWKKRNEDKQDG